MIRLFNISFVLITILINNVTADELIIGEEVTKNNIRIIFEGAPKDTVFNNDKEIQLLKEKDTDIHLEALINWNDNIKIKGQSAGGFIPYLDVEATVINQRTNEFSNIKLIPHINLSDGYHYAQNIRLPGSNNDLYTVEFNVKESMRGMTYHMDWKEKYFIPLIGNITFSYQNIDFKEMSETLRR